MVGVALVVPVSAWADFPGSVVAVVDGDSITVLRGRDQVKVRLVGIDAPEKAQPSGNRSKQAERRGHWNGERIDDDLSVWYEDPALREAHHVVSKAST